MQRPTRTQYVCPSTSLDDFARMGIKPFERARAHHNKSQDFKMRIAVFGAGGIGGYFGARLAQAGNDVALIARGSHL